MTGAALPLGLRPRPIAVGRAGARAAGVLARFARLTATAPGPPPSRRGRVPRRRCTAAGSAARAARMKSRSLIGSFLPGSDSTPVATSTPHGPDPIDGLGHVRRRQPSGQDDAAADGRALGQRPVEHLARPGRRRVDHDRVGAVVIGAIEARVPRRERLDHHRHPGPDPPGLLGRLPAVQLGGPQPGVEADRHHPLGHLVAEHADGEDLGRQPAGDVAGSGQRDLPWRGANTKPTASAPKATASRASSSRVMPQIFTNTASRVPAGSTAELDALSDR